MWPLPQLGSHEKTQAGLKSWIEKDRNIIYARIGVKRKEKRTSRSIFGVTVDPS
jgi:hypothetical protein